MEQFLYYLKVSLKSIRRAPLPYALTILILSLGLGVFFANATFYYRLNADPLPHKSDKLFFPFMNLVPYECQNCEPPNVLSYSNVQKLSATDIPSAKAAMYSADGYLRLTPQQPPLPVKIRLTQPDFFRMFEVPFLHGSVWPDASARAEVILSRQAAEKIFGETDVVGRRLTLDDFEYTVSAVLADWTMLPRLFDANNNKHLSEVEDIYLPLETGYDRNYLSNSQSSSFQDADYRKLATDGRTKAIHQLQFWVQLDTPEQQQAYRQFMANLTADEKKAGRHPSTINNKLVGMRDIVAHFNQQGGDIKAFALVTLLFLLVCLFNASHLSLNRYIANQYEISLRRALGASRWHIQQQALADVLLMAGITSVAALLIGYSGISLMNYLLPANRLFSSWDWALLLSLLAVTLGCSYLVTLYPSLRASFGALNQQLKE